MTVIPLAFKPGVTTEVVETDALSGIARAVLFQVFAAGSGRSLERSLAGWGWYSIRSTEIASVASSKDTPRKGATMRARRFQRRARRRCIRSSGDSCRSGRLVSGMASLFSRRTVMVVLE